MLYAKHRLTKDKDIERVYKSGRSFFMRDLGIRVAKNNLKTSRFAVVTSVKTSKKAVERNKLKRRLREIIRKEILPNAKQGYDGVIMTKKSLLELSFDELKDITLKLFKKAKLV